MSMMNRAELISLLEELKIPTDEGIQKDENKNKYPRIVFWDFDWEPLTASDEKYTDKVTYQISFFARTHRSQKLLELKRKLADKKIYSNIQHEYIEKTREWHSFFAVEVLEKIE